MATPNLQAITTVTPGVLGDAQLASGDTVLYTVGTSKAAKLGSLVLDNTSTTATAVVSVSTTKSGGTARKTVSAYTMQPGETIVVDELNGMWRGAGDVVTVNSSVAAQVDATLTGLEFS